MKARAFTTITVWLIVMGSIYAFINNLTRVVIVDYVEFTYQTPMFDGSGGMQEMTSQMPVYDTMYAPDIMMIISAIIVLVLIIAATVATVSIWKNASEKATAQVVTPPQTISRPQSNSSKMKMEQRQRALTLLESLSPEELEALEQSYLTDGTGETIPLYALAEQERARSRVR